MPCNLPENENMFPEKKNIERFQEKEKMQSTQALGQKRSNTSRSSAKNITTNKHTISVCTKIKSIDEMEKNQKIKLTAVNFFRHSPLMSSHCEMFAIIHIPIIFIIRAGGVGGAIQRVETVLPSRGRRRSNNRTTTRCRCCCRRRGTTLLHRRRPRRRRRTTLDEIRMDKRSTTGR